MRCCDAYFLFLTLFSFVYGTDDALSEMSRYRGYLIWKNELDDPGIQYDLEEIILGMRLAAKGQVPEIENPDSLNEKISKLLEVVVQKKKIENLALAETFLRNIQRKHGVKEVVKDRLYYKQLKQGFGETVNKYSTPRLVYSVKTIDQAGEEDDIGSTEPKPIKLSNVILGLEEGVVGMCVGERRVLFIHPDLAYGPHSSWVPSNSLLIITVEVISL
jgi:peptidylprolyl isomerase